jgi:hypothetical protein
LSLVGALASSSPARAAGGCDEAFWEDWRNMCSGAVDPAYQCSQGNDGSHAWRCYWEFGGGYCLDVYLNSDGTATCSAET